MNSFKPSLELRFFRKFTNYLQTLRKNIGKIESTIYRGFNFIFFKVRNFSYEDIKELVLSVTKDKSLYLLTFDNEAKAIYFGYRMTNEERQWLYEIILEFYNLTHLHRMIEMDESRPKKRIINLLLWTVPLIIFVLIK